MDINKQIKIFLIENDMTMKKLAEEFSKIRGKECTLSNLSQRISKGRMPFDDVEMLLKILGYKIKFEKE